MTSGVSFEISDEAAKAIMMGAVILGIGYLVYRLLKDTPEEEIPLPPEAKDFTMLPEVTPKTIEQLGYHPEVRERATPLLRDGHHVAAVREAAVALYDVVRRKSGLNFDGTQLITRAFRGAGRILEFVEIAPAHIINAEDGLVGYLESFSKYTRKIQMHATVSLSREDALLQVNIAGFLAEQVEERTVTVRAEGSSDG